MDPEWIHHGSAATVIKGASNPHYLINLAPGMDKVREWINVARFRNSNPKPTRRKRRRGAKKQRTRTTQLRLRLRLRKR